jgi:hypothetical protein
MRTSTDNGAESCGALLNLEKIMSEHRATSHSGEQPVQQTTATNAQKPKNSPHAVESDTTCVHGHTNFVQYLMNSSYANAAVYKTDSFNQHQRVLSSCNCTLA